MKKKPQLGKLILIVFALVLLASILVIGCAKKTTTSPTGSQYGGILKIGMDSDARSLGDPLDTWYQTHVMGRPALEVLGRYDEQGIMTPWLAESWDEDASAMTFTIKLRKGVKFHDGTDFNAEAVKWNWQRFIDSKDEAVAAVKSIDIVDTYTIRANLSTWDNYITYNLCNYAGIMVSPTAWETNGSDWGEKNPVGTGPFQFVSWERDQSVKYKKFDGYWQKGKP